MFVWFICDTILYNIIVCMRLLCLTMYICMHCGIICLLCARLRFGGRFCLYAFMEFLRPVIASQEVRRLYMAIFTGKLCPKITISF